MPLKLSQAKKKTTFHLPIEQAVFVPSTRLDKPVSKKVFEKRIQKVKKFLSKKFGGYTAVRGAGGYYSTEKHKVIQEPVVIVESFSTKKAFNKNKKALMKKLGEWRRNWEQESIGYEHEGDLYYFEKQKRRKKIKDFVRRKGK